MVIFSGLMNILIIENVCNIIKIVAETLLCGVTGGCAILGVSYLRKLKEKKQESLAGFWIQFGAQIIMINNRIQDFPELLSSMCSDDSIEKLSVDQLENDFYAIVKNTLDFIKCHDNQIPLVPGWTENYFFFITFLNDYDQYHYKKDGVPYFYKFQTANELDSYRKKQIRCMQQLINIINNELKKLESL